MRITKNILQVLLIAQFTFFGLSKIGGAPDMVTTFTAFGFPMWFMICTGAIEVTAAACLIYGFIKPNSVYVGAFLLAGLTIGATMCHALLEGSMPNAIIPLVVFLQNGLMVWLHDRVSTAPRPKVSQLFIDMA